MKKVLITHDTLIHYTGWFGRRCERREQATDVFIDPETAEERQEIVNVHRGAKEILDPLHKLLRSVMKLDEAVDNFNKLQVIFAHKSYHLAYHHAPLLLKPFTRRTPEKSFLDSLTIKKNLIVDLDVRIEEIIQLIDEPLYFPILEDDYTTLMNLDYFIKYLMKEFVRVKASINAECEQKRAKLLNVQK